MSPISDLNQYDSKTIWIFIGILIVIVFCSGFYIGKSYLATNNTVSDTFITESETLSDKIRVYVCGAVNVPGLYELTSKDCVNDAIKIAGGATDKADLMEINLAKALKGGEKITIPFKIDTISGSGSASSNKSNLAPITSKKSSLININSASKEELMELPGIGEVKAQAIIDYRDNNGFFIDIEEIQKVSGIGPKTFEKLKDKIEAN